MKDILFISPSFYPAIYYGGPIFCSYDLAKAIKKQNIDIKVVTTNANGKDRLKVKTGLFHKLENDLPVKYYKSLDSRGTSFSMFINLYSEIKKADIVYIISVFSPPTPIAIFLCKYYKKPLIISPHGQLGSWCLAQGNRFKKIWLKLFIKPQINNLWWHLTSKEEERDVLAVYPNAKTFVIPNGIDTKSIEVIDQKKDILIYRKYSASLNENSRIIISMGRLQKVKGFDILIEAFDILLNNNPDCFLFIAGVNFGERNNLLNLISSKNLLGKIFLVGHIEGEEKVNFLKNADVFVLPSHHENFGMSVVEAMACNCPVVISDKVGIYKEILENNAGVVSQTNPKSVEEGILKVLNDSDLRNELAKNARAMLEKYYDINGVANSFISKYKNILNV